MKVTQVPVDNYIDATGAEGIPEELQWLSRELLTVVFDGKNSQVMTGGQQAPGHPATGFSTYVLTTVASGVWDPLPHHVIRWHPNKKRPTMKRLSSLACMQLLFTTSAGSALAGEIVSPPRRL